MNYIENNGLYYRNHHHGGHNHGGHHHHGGHNHYDHHHHHGGGWGWGGGSSWGGGFFRKLCRRSVRRTDSWCINRCNKWRILSGSISSSLSITIPCNVSNAIPVISKYHIRIKLKRGYSLFSLIQYLFIK